MQIVSGSTPRRKLQDRAVSLVKEKGERVNCEDEKST
jgi:hypothetical protein